MFFSKKPKQTEVATTAEPIQSKVDKEQIIKQGRLDFTTAIANFSLAHAELLSFSVNFKLKDLRTEATQISTVSLDSATTHKKISASSMAVKDSMNDMWKMNNDYLGRSKQLDNLKSVFTQSFGDVVEHSTVLNDQIKQVDEIAKQIVDIANRTNLLALNASIEAARAGEAGKGFSVVAQEIGQLSAKTKESIAEVNTVSKNITEKSKLTNVAISEVKGALNEYVDATSMLSTVIASTTQEIKKNSTIIEDITNTSKTQNSSIQTITDIATVIESSSQFGKFVDKSIATLVSTAKPALQIKENNYILTILGMRLVNHADFLRNICKNAGTLKTVPNHNECAFGKWYNNHRQTFKHIREFNDIYSVHERFHRIAKDLNAHPTIELICELAEESCQILDCFLKLADAFEREIKNGNDHLLNFQ